MTHDPFLVQLRSFLASALAYPVALALMVGNHNTNETQTRTQAPKVIHSSKYVNKPD